MPLIAPLQRLSYTNPIYYITYRKSLAWNRISRLCCGRTKEGLYTYICIQSIHTNTTHSIHIYMQILFIRYMVHSQTYHKATHPPHRHTQHIECTQYATSLMYGDTHRNVPERCTKADIHRFFRGIPISVRKSPNFAAQVCTVNHIHIHRCLNRHTCTFMVM